MIATSKWAEIVIPTFNSKRWIQAIVRSYEKQNVAPLFMVDSQSTDGTLEAIMDVGGRAIEVELRFPRVEAAISLMRDHVGSGWVFRVDDDEFPSTHLFD